MKFDVQKAIAVIDAHDFASDMWKTKDACELKVYECFEFSDEDEKERILTYMKSIALGAQQERDFMPQRRWNESLQEYVPILPSSTWSAGKTLVRLLGYRTGKSLSTKTLETHRDFIRLVVRGFCEPSEITWEYNGYRGLDRAYVLEGFGVLKKVFALLEATRRESSRREQLKDAENRVVSASAAAKDAQAKQFDARAALLLEIGDSDDLVPDTAPTL